MRIDKVQRNDLSQIVRSEVPVMTARERRQRINATLKHWAYLGWTFIPSPAPLGTILLGKPLRAMHHNAVYCVMEFGAPGGMTHLAIRRHDEEGQFPWYDLQRIKNEFAGPERVAVEVFPKESELIDGANMRHLWVYPDGHQLGFGL